MLVILQVEFLVGIICHTFGQFTVEDWEPFHSISVSLTVADYCSLAGVHLDFSEQKPFSEWSLPVAPRLTSNATTYGSTLGIWTSNFHLALDKSILTIANYSWNWKLDPKLGSLIE
jgi:hypothetical protein